MTWKQLLQEGRVERHRTSQSELDALRAVVARNLADAAVSGVSPDTRFGCAYEAALILATAAIAVAGYRVRGAAHHRTSFEALPLALSGQAALHDAHYFDRCRRLRNEMSYEAAGLVDEGEVLALLGRVHDFEHRVATIVSKRHPGAWKNRAR